ncbi:Hypothetical protein D9617_28g065490 [Elsinoe fawcettii]|nr:Hypothetical protein D9617_28g065490 [Elsinoe fawcettii]
MSSRRAHRALQDTASYMVRVFNFIDTVIYNIMAEAFVFLTTVNAYDSAQIALRSLIELGLYTSISPQEVQDLARFSQISGASEELLIRLFRPLVGLKFLTQHTIYKYSPTPLFLAFQDPKLRAAFVWGYDDLLTANISQPRWLKRHGFASPTDPEDTPWSLTHGGDAMFKTLDKDAEKAALFNATQEFRTIGLTTTYPFHKEITWCGRDDVVVDVGGGRGQACRDLAAAFPGLKDRLLLQDQASVLHSVPENVKSVIKEAMPYNFFDPQPVKGMLLLTLYAMTEHSKLLIGTLLIPETGCDPSTAAVDLNVMSYGGKERTEEDFKELFAAAGLELVRVC